MEEVTFEEVCHLQGPEDSLSFERVDNAVTGGLARMTQGTTEGEGRRRLGKAGSGRGRPAGSRREFLIVD